MPSRLNAQRFFLTYSQSPTLSCDAIANFLQESHPHFAWCEVVREFHQDDGIHFHAVVAYSGRIQRTTSAFDIEGRHPNILVTKRGRQLADRRWYLRKDLGEGEEVTTRGTPPDIEEAERLTWYECLHNAADKETFLENVRINYTKEYIIHHDAICSFAQAHYNPPSDYEDPFPAESWRIPEHLEDWVTNVLAEVSDTRRLAGPPFGLMFFLRARSREPLVI